MVKKRDIEVLCKEHTNLTQDQIEIIYKVVKNLQLTADLSRANIFIDCLTKDGKYAIVIAEASPNTAKSLYKEPVVGKIAYEAFEPAVFYCLRTGNEMFLNRAVTQEGRVVEQNVVPIKDLSNNVIAALIMEKDISEKIKYQNELQTLTKTTEMLGEILIGFADNNSIIPELMDEALFIIDPSNQEILYCNPSAINLVKEICHKDCQLQTPIVDYFPSVAEIIHSNEEILIKELLIFNKIFEVKKINLKSDGKVNGILLIFRDLTELREKERELIVKSVAIREIHHRVKNNLQQVASLLRLQMRKVPNDSKRYFEDSLNRILSISSVYEMILSTSSIDEVDIFGLIKKVGDILIYNDAKYTEKSITIIYKGEELFVPSQTAISIALIVNELIQNCINHAFKESDKKGIIEVVLIKNNTNLVLQVIDNGIGYSQTSKPSLGLEITRMMVEHDLSGEFNIQGTKDGTIATVEFPLNKDDCN